MGPSQRGQASRARDHVGSYPGLRDVGEVPSRLDPVVLVGDLADVDKKGLRPVEMGDRMSGHGRDAKRLDEVGAGAGRDHAERSLGVDGHVIADHAVDHFEDRPVPAHRDDELAAALDGGAGQLGSVAGALSLRDLVGKPALAQVPLDLGQRLGDSTAPRPPVAYENHWCIFQSPNTPGFMIP